jgi:hypothetical protein
MFSKFLPENRVVYEIMWKNTVQRGRTDGNTGGLNTAEER